ncbi:hypothetical protein P175DRAFT_0508796 [Aspergillus ochraceoroseus IBT 24754]|uniref:Uncharacterized protein n=1 Tax=Aspergillus ochraceoroseus IBT 24754 TaxID=1392256 RepID=A0A2T5M035_9EURO|nr:uncharacterized protein P175DRAFT_0508796 [Aspergillus ochraceoroseus IBT 24754]PTU21901.1 hypothetical protein P175DRAFT_0508796 [Aspergillus ochraceoroseus IBT 24754]
MSSKPRIYLSNGEILQNPPISVRIRRFFESLYLILGLYFTSFFTLDAYTAAQNSPFNVANPTNRSNTRARWVGPSGPGGGNGGGGGGGDGGPPRPPRRIGRVDDIRGPECKSCR